jgi:hypothetical protein
MNIGSSCYLVLGVFIILCTMGFLYFGGGGGWVQLFLLQMAEVCFLTIYGFVNLV